MCWQRQQRLPIAHLVPYVLWLEQPASADTLTRLCNHWGRVFIYQRQGSCYVLKASPATVRCLDLLRARVVLRGYERLEAR